MIRRITDHVKGAWGEMRLRFRLCTILMTILVFAEFATFIIGYRHLNQSMQNERIDSVGQLGALISEKLSLLRGQFEVELRQSAQTLMYTGVSTSREANAVLADTEDLYLMTAGGACLSLQGAPIVFSSEQITENLLYSEEISSAFATVQGKGDFWIFAIPLHGMTIDDQTVVGLLKLVDAKRYEDITATTLYDDKGAAYVVDGNGTILLRPAVSSVNAYFKGYNFIQILQSENAAEKQVQLLQQALLHQEKAEIVVSVLDHTWLIQSFPDEGNRNIVMAIPISITAQETFSGMSFVIVMIALMLMTISALFLIWIFHYVRINQKIKLESAKAELKSDFLNKISHDIRTPLNAIVGMLELSMRAVSDDDPVADYLKKARKSSQYLLEIINDVLDMSRIDCGKMRIARSPFDMRELLDTVMELSLYPAAEKELNLQLERPASCHAAFQGDALRIKQCLVNLVSNAIKFTPQKGTVTLRYEELGERDNLLLVRFTVVDTGIGMDPEFLPNIFKPFEQEKSSLTSPHVGSGLGLAIVHSLVTLMNGSVQVESELGVGTKFVIDLPLERTDPSALSAPAESELPADLSDKRILLAEDNDLNREIIADLLANMGLAVDTAENGADAVEKFKAAPENYYAMILMDIQMPVMNGLEAAEAIRSSRHKDAEKIPIVALSANAFDEDIENSLCHGMQAHLSKPIDISQLQKLFRQYLERRPEP